MRYYFNFLLILLITFSGSSFAQQNEEALSKSEIIQITNTMKGLADKAKTLKGDRLSIVQLEIYNMNQKLRKELNNAIDRKDHDVKFLTSQIELQTKYYEFYLKYVESKLDSMQVDIEKSSKDERLLKQIPLNEMRTAQANLYAEQYQNYAWLQKLDVNVDDKLKSFAARLEELAHYTSAALNYSLRHKELLQSQLDGLPAGQTDQINLEVSYLQRDIDTYSKALALLVDTGDSPEHQYR
ncbi:hypothetical protein [Vibrio rumoiensis]|uniref:hypothetical protein n=1 Tax=Vibrio rumoiensis TaxID=76258 RepID=UPI003AA898E7